MKYFLFGTSVIIEKELEKISKAFEKIDPEHLNFFKFGGRIDLGKITDAIFSPPFLGEKKLVFLRNFLLENDKKLVQELLTKLSNTPEFSSIVWSESGQELEKNPTIKKIIGSCLFEVKNFSALTPAAISNWIKERASTEKLDFPGPALSRLIALTEGDLEKIENECEKLFLYAQSQGKKEITIESIELLVKSNYNESVFKFLDAISQKNKKKAFVSLHALLESGQNELYIASMLAYQFRIILSVKELKGEGLSEAAIAKELKVHPFVVKKNLNLVGAFSFVKLKKIFFRLKDFDTKVKRGLSDPHLEIFLLADKLCQ